MGPYQLITPSEGLSFPIVVVLFATMFILLLLNVLITFGSQRPIVQAVTVQIPLAAPSSAATLNPALLSFSIEQDRWTDWAGVNEPNTFFLNALNNLAERTGEVPWIRIGADSEDHTNFNPQLQVSLK